MCRHLQDLLCDPPVLTGEVLPAPKGLEHFGLHHKSHFSFTVFIAFFVIPCSYPSTVLFSCTCKHAPKFSVFGCLTSISQSPAGEGVRGKAWGAPERECMPNLLNFIWLYLVSYLIFLLTFIFLVLHSLFIAFLLTIFKFACPCFIMFCSHSDTC